MVFTVTVEIVLGFAVRVVYIMHRLTVTINLNSDSKKIDHKS